MGVTFERVAIDAGDEAEQVWKVRAAIHARALDGGAMVDVDAIADWPDAPRTVFFVDLVDAVVSAKGLETFFHQANALEIREGLRALEAVGALGFAARYRAGLKLAVDCDTELAAAFDAAWLAETALDDAAAWDELDSFQEGGSYWLLEHELRPKLAAFVDAHLADLVAV